MKIRGYELIKIGDLWYGVRGEEKIGGLKERGELLNFIYAAKDLYSKSAE